MFLPLKSNNAPHDLARDDYGNMQIRIRNQGSGKTFYKLEMEQIIFAFRVFWSAFPIETGRKLNVHKTFRRSLLNVLCTFNSRPVSTG